MKIGMALSHAAMLLAVIFVVSTILLVVAPVAMVGFCRVVDWPACRVLLDPD